MADPLAGVREQINEGELDVLVWPDDGTGCPVEVGQVYPLRSCAIEITGTRRFQRGRGSWFWRATFERIYPSRRVYLLAARGAGDEGHGYTTEKGALESGDERPEWEPLEGDTVPVGSPPEPEAVPPHEVKDLPTSIASRRRYEEQHQADLERDLSRSLTSRVREVVIRAQRSGVDVSDEVAQIEEAAERARRKVQRAA